jgi:hypothetical protein
MKTLQKLLAAILLALVLGTTAYAGDMPCPPAPDPPPPASAPASGGNESPTNAIPGLDSSAAPAAPAPTVDTTTLVNLLLGLLSMY